MPRCKTVDILHWLNQALLLPGKSPIRIASFLLDQGLKVRRSCFLQVSKRDLERIAMSRVAAYDALNALEDAGLVVLDRSQGRAPVVTLIGLEFE